MVGGAFLLLAALDAQTRPAGAPRVAPVADNGMTAEAQNVAAQFASLGMPNAVATYLNHPLLAQALLPHVQYVWRQSTLPVRHRALLGLRTAWLAHSQYLWSHRAAAARGEGFTDAELRRIAEGVPLFGPGDWPVLSCTAACRREAPRRVPTAGLSREVLPCPSATCWGR